MRVGIVGLGYVGLPLAVAFAEQGHEVVGVDADARKVDALARGESYVEDVASERVKALSGKLSVTTGYEQLAEADAIFVCVPTPLTPDGEPDLSALDDAGSALAGILQRGQLVVLESTTYPGTTRERFVPLLEASGLVAGQDFNIAFSPERVDPGRTDYTLRNTPRLIGGLTELCGDRAEAVYGEVCDEIVRVSTPDVAELAKLLENIFRSVNIALVNELGLLCDRMDIDIWEVIDAAATKPYGFMRFDPGPGMGGHCLPVDPFYLAWRARDFDMSTEFIELAGRINRQMPDHCVARIERALERPVSGSKIALVGVSYKPGTADTRESPGLKMIALLRARGADVVYHDPYVAELPNEALRSLPLAEALDGADCAVIVTAHPDVDHGRIARDASLLVDLRGVTRLSAG